MATTQPEKVSREEKGPASAGDPVDTRGHSVADAEAHQPALDPSAPPASVEEPEAGEIVRAQSAEEVQAQIDNKPGGDNPTQA